MKYIALSLFGFIFYSCALNAQITALQRMDSANNAYESGEYQVANNLYDSLIREDFVSEDLYYNYANSLFKTNQIALAILHYEKALKINPNSEDALYNLKIANERTVDKIEAIPELFIYRWWRAIYNLFEADYWAKIMIAILLFSLIGFGMYKIAQQLTIRKIGFGIFITGIAFALFCWILAASQKNYASKSTHAIIMNSTVDILSAPSAGSSQLFVLHEGTKVKIEDQNDAWFKVSLPNGNQGWIIKKALAEI